MKMVDSKKGTYLQTVRIPHTAQPLTVRFLATGAKAVPITKDLLEYDQESVGQLDARLQARRMFSWANLPGYD